jgi:hypothetical protein
MLEVLQGRSLSYLDYFEHLRLSIFAIYYLPIVYQQIEYCVNRELLKLETDIYLDFDCLNFVSKREDRGYGTKGGQNKCDHKGDIESQFILIKRNMIYYFNILGLNDCGRWVINLLC